MADVPAVRITNEVLQERLTNYYERTLNELRGIRDELARMNGRVARTEERVLLSQEWHHSHESSAGHAATLEKLLENTKTLNSHHTEFEKLKEKALLEEGMRKARNDGISLTDKVLIRAILVVGAIPTVYAIWKELV